MASDNFDDLLQNVPSTQDAVNLQLAGIGLTEIALARLLNAEVDTLRQALDSGANLNTLFRFNRKAERILRAVIKKEMILEFMLEDLIDFPFPPGVVVAITNLTATPNAICPGQTSVISGNVIVNGAPAPIGTLVVFNVDPASAGTIQPTTVTSANGGFSSTFTASNTFSGATITAIVPGTGASASVEVNLANNCPGEECCAQARLIITEPVPITGTNLFFRTRGNICEDCDPENNDFVLEILDTNQDPQPGNVVETIDALTVTQTSCGTTPAGGRTINVVATATSDTRGAGLLALTFTDNPPPQNDHLTLTFIPNDVTQQPLVINEDVVSQAAQINDCNDAG